MKECFLIVLLLMCSINLFSSELSPCVISTNSKITDFYFKEGGFGKESKKFNYNRILDLENKKNDMKEYYKWSYDPTSKKIMFLKDKVKMTVFNPLSDIELGRSPSSVVAIDSKPVDGIKYINNYLYLHVDNALKELNDIVEKNFSKSDLKLIIVNEPESRGEKINYYIKILGYKINQLNNK